MARDDLEQFRKILEGALDAYVAIEDGIVVEWNGRAEGTFGWSRAEAMGRDIGELILPPEARVRLVKAPPSTEKPGLGPLGRLRGQLTAQRRDGTEIHLELSVTPSPRGDGWRFHCFLRDISPSERLKSELEARVAELGAIFDSFPDLYFWLDQDDTIVKFHAGRSSDLYVSSETFLGKRFQEVLPAAPAERLSRACYEARSGRVLTSVEYSLPMPGREQFFEARLVPMLENQLLVVIRDITGRVELLAAERTARDQAEEATRSRDDFLSVASHELRTPIASLQLAVQSVLVSMKQGEGPDGEVVVRSMAVAGRQVGRLCKLLDMLDVSRIEVGSFELDRQPLELTGLVREVAAGYAQEAERVGCRLAVTADREIRGEWDGARIEQVIANLLGNALKYGAGSPIELAVSESSGLARISVRDQGVGVAPERHQEIFERYQSSGATTRERGLGLGLFIVRRIMEAHGGRVTLTSARDAGATFVAELPDARSS